MTEILRGQLSAPVASQPWRRVVSDVAASFSPTSAADRTPRRRLPTWSLGGRTELEPAADGPGWRKLLARFADPLIGRAWETG